MNKKLIVHVSDINISLESGMGRIEYYWKEAFEKSGFTFIHIGTKEVGKLLHKVLFPYKAYSYFKNLNVTPKGFIVHESASGQFVNRGIPCFIESHGIERRSWEGMLDGAIPPPNNRPLSLKTKLIFPLWRLYNCDKGLKNAHKLLLSNSDDKTYVKHKFERKEEDIFIFKNGIIPSSLSVNKSPNHFTVLFNANWVERKGIHTLVKAAELLMNDGLIIHYRLIGTGKDENSVLSDWPEQLRQYVKVTPHFAQTDESKWLESCSLFVLPSFFEGQPLSLLQAMASGKCCITTNSCGQKDVIQNEKTGFLFEAGDYKELASLINNCYHKKEIIQSVGNNAREYMQNYRWDKVSGEVVDFVAGNI